MLKYPLNFIEGILNEELATIVDEMHFEKKNI